MSTTSKAPKNKLGPHNWDPLAAFEEGQREPRIEALDLLLRTGVYPGVNLGTKKPHLLEAADRIVRRGPEYRDGDELQQGRLLLAAYEIGIEMGRLLAAGLPGGVR